MQNGKKNLHENIEDLSGVGEETIELTQVGGGDMLQCIIFIKSPVLMNSHKFVTCIKMLFYGNNQ